ncbi:MAG TPA: ketoacyl-ACP synthase III [Bryobacteraceae bacterium]|nr:ketoacyl-ACP synthase III [Bryobacteraceae bacterium]
MIGIEAIAYAFPAARVTNADLKAQYPGWDFERLEKRTGVLSRYVAGPGETALDFAVSACEKLAARGRLAPERIDAVIFCTQTPDYLMPPNACLLHGKLSLAPGVPAFDINLACSGYIYGLQLAVSLLKSGAAKRVLLATADTYTRYIHPGDRATRCLFGDGGAVSVISEAEDGWPILDIRCGTAGKHFDKFLIPAGGMRCPRSAESARETVDSSGNVRTAEHIRMDGMGVLSFFNSTIPPVVRDALCRNGLEMDDIGLFVFHQASQVALDSLRSALRIPPEKLVLDLAEVGNLVSASIPVALQHAIEHGAAGGQRVLLCGFGVGLSWGTALIEI